MPIVNMEKVTFFYPGQKEAALRKVNLTLNSGEFILLIGPSGCGKTTLLQTIAGVVPFSTGGRIKGKVLIEGTDILRSSDKKRGEVGLVLQDPEAQLTNLYVEDEIAFGPENLCLPEQEIRERVTRMLQLAHIEDIKNSFVYALSGGQKQRVAIAAGLAMEPRLLLMDGPTTNLDPRGAHDVLNLIKTLTESRATETVLLSSNKIDVLLPLATRIVVMDKGQIILVGTPKEVILDNQELLERIGVFIPELGKLAKNLCLRALPKEIEELKDFYQGREKRLVWSVKRTDNVFGNGKTAIELEGVRFGYGEEAVIKDLSLTVAQGELLAVVGQNGCGKTTLMKLIAGLYQPWKGTVKIGGKYTTEESPLGKVGYVFQYPEHQFVAQTVEEELLFGLRELGEERPQAKVDKVLNLFGLEKKKDQTPYSLSMGEKRLLSVATMVILEPEILILDEPTTGLDRKCTRTLMNILRMLVKEQDITLIQVTHDMEQVAEYATRTIVLNGGNIVFEGTPRELFLNDQLLQQCSLQAPPVVELSKKIWPTCHNIPLTVEQLTEV